MQFCEKCGTVMEIDPKKKVLTCRKCHNVEPLDESKTFIKRIKMYDPKANERLIVVSDDIEPSTIKIGCPKCGYNRASYKERPPSRADEDGLTIYTCMKCKHSWREGYMY